MSGAPGLHSGGRGNPLDDLTWLWQVAAHLTSPLWVRAATGFGGAQGSMRTRGPLFLSQMSGRQQQSLRRRREPLVTPRPQARGAALSQPVSRRWWGW